MGVGFRVGTEQAGLGEPPRRRRMGHAVLPGHRGRRRAGPDQHAEVGSTGQFLRESRGIPASRRTAATRARLIDSSTAISVSVRFPARTAADLDGSGSGPRHHRGTDRSAAGPALATTIGLVMHGSCAIGKSCPTDIPNQRAALPPNKTNCSVGPGAGRPHGDLPRGEDQQSSVSRYEPGSSGRAHFDAEQALVGAAGF